MKYFMLIGRTGVGKSSFINTAFGVNTASISHYESCTKVVKHYSKSSQWGEFCLFDTPGLCEDNDVLDDKYLGLIRNDKSIPHNVTVIYVTVLNDTRFRREEKLALKKIHDYFPSYFSNMWVVFTFAASVDDARRREVSTRRRNDIEDYIKSYNKNFKGFSEVAMVDNVVSNWSTSSITPDEFFCR